MNLDLSYSEISFLRETLIQERWRRWQDFVKLIKKTEGKTEEETAILNYRNFCTVVNPLEPNGIINNILMSIKVVEDDIQKTLKEIKNHGKTKQKKHKS